MKKISILILFAGLICFSSASYAADIDGYKLLKMCSETEKEQSNPTPDVAYGLGYCIGLVQGVRNTLEVMDSYKENSKIRACLPPKGMSNGQAIKIILAYLRNRPDMLDQDAFALVGISYMKAFPCK